MNVARTRNRRLRPHVFDPAIRAENDTTVGIGGSRLIEPQMCERCKPGIEPVGGEVEGLPSQKIEVYRR